MSAMLVVSRRESKFQYQGGSFCRHNMARIRKLRFLFIVLILLPCLALSEEVEYVVIPAWDVRREVESCNSIQRQLQSRHLGLSSMERFNSPVRDVTEFWLIEARDPSKLDYIRDIRGVRKTSVFLPRFVTSDLEVGC